MIERNTSPDFKVKDEHPWYKNYMVLIFVIGLPLFVVIACIWLVYYSIQIQDSVVRDDWYMDGKTLYQDVSRDKLTHDLDLHGEMLFKENGEVVFFLQYPQASVQSGKLNDGSTLTYPDKLELSISHATDITKDCDVILTHKTDNQYVTHVELDPLLSKYYVQISNDGVQNWRMRETTKLPSSKINFEPLKSFD